MVGGGGHGTAALRVSLKAAIGAEAGLYLFHDLRYRPVACAAVDAFPDRGLKLPVSGASFLVPADQVADILAVIGEAAGGDPGLDPSVLPVG